MRLSGWLLDASIDCNNDGLTLWIKKNGKTRGLVYTRFNPSLYISFNNQVDRTLEDLARSIEEHPLVTRTTIEQKFASVYDETRTQVIRVFTTPCAFRQVAGDLERIPHATVYHGDIDPIQQFFIEEELFPFERIEAKVDERGHIIKVRGLDDREAVEYETPLLDEIQLEVFIRTGRIFPQLDDPIQRVEIYHEGETIRIEDDDERAILQELQKTIDGIDPDIIVTNGGDEFLFQYLTLRANVNGLKLVFSRDGSPLQVVGREPTSFWQYNRVVFRAGNQVMFKGRIHIDRAESLYYSPSGLEGIIEGCRLAFVPPQRTARMSIGSVNAAVQYYTAFKMGILIPPIKKNPEFLKTVSDLRIIDRGGLIFQPEPGIYENVAECDFSSMYPTLMVNHNISPETICLRKSCEFNERFCREIPGVPYRICDRRRGIVAKALEIIVKKRNGFKKMIQEGHDARKYRLMQNTLKGVLVSCFGYLGFKNARFGRVEAHTAVTAFARETLLRTREIGEEMGLEAIHGIVDSLWVRSPHGVDYELIQKFCKRVTEEVGIEMSLKGFYRWLVIPSSRLHPSIAPLNRYYGVFLNGSIKTRGIETRRHDTCSYVSDCQQEMIKTLAQAADKSEFIRLIPKAQTVCEEYIQRLYRGDVDYRDLVLHARLTRDPDEYRTTSRAALAAQQLKKAGRELHAGQRVRYILVHSNAKIPEQRVRSLELVDRDVHYDPDAYAILCRRAFENLIPFQYLNAIVENSQW
ncbi:MAG: DNA polymerase domain-containing protein [Candidatus Thorarchaeota archaeon]